MPNAKSAIPRRPLARMVTSHLDAMGLGRVEAGRLTGESATQMSRLFQGHLAEFSSERLIGMLLRLMYDVEISVKPAKRPGKVRVLGRHARP